MADKAYLPEIRSQRPATEEQKLSQRLQRLRHNLEIRLDEDACNLIYILILNRQGRTNEDVSLF